MKLKVENLSFNYPRHGVFENLNLEVDFETLLLMGPSGGGKSTLLRLLSGLEVPRAGAIRWNDDVMPAREQDLREFRTHIGVVFQAFNLFPHLTVLENVCLPLVKVHGKSRDEAVEAAKEFLRAFSLSDQVDKKPQSLSGGQQQRAAIIRALIVKPKLIFLDEPTSALDPYMTREVFKMIMDLKQQYKVPVVLVTHHVTFAQKMGGEVLILKDGKLHKQGAAVKLLAGDEEQIYESLVS